MSDGIPFIGFGNDTLEKLPIVHIGDMIICDKCGEQHKLFGDDNGGDLLLSFKCNGVLFLGAVHNRLIIGVKPDVSG